MSQAAFDPYISEPGIFTTKVRMVGTGASAPTKTAEVDAPNVTITRPSGAGQYRLTCADTPGLWCGPEGLPGLQAATPGDIKGMVVIVGPFTAATADADAYVDLYVYDGGSAHDLAASEWITVDLDFRRARS